MAMILRMWELKVERLCSMPCSSPMSAAMKSIQPTWVPSAAGTGKPDRARKMPIATDFSTTVLPPVFGPVMMS